MKASYYLWGWLGLELLTLWLVSDVVGFGFYFLAVVAGSYLGWWFLRKRLRGLALRGFKLNADADGFAIVGGFLLFLPGLFNSLLASLFVVKPLRERFAARLWQWLHPERIYDHYREQVNAYNSEGEKVEAELLREKKK